MSRLKIVVRTGIILLFAAVLIYRAVVITSERALRDFEVRGVDVSSYQGEIDWVKLAENDIDFAFIKATEGSSFKDREFPANIEGIKKTDLAAGAYHFFSFESDGKSQAENFISTVAKEDISLPPVIDLELYGEYKVNIPEVSYVRENLGKMVSALYEEYGTYPIIYTNRRAYTLYVSGEYKDCDIWICDLVKNPSLPDGRKWTFWQYSHTEKLPGYRGEEKYIDMNVFYGSKKEFEEYKKRSLVTSLFVLLSNAEAGEDFGDD